MHGPPSHMEHPCSGSHIASNCGPQHSVLRCRITVTYQDDKDSTVTTVQVLIDRNMLSFHRYPCHVG